MAKKKFKVSSSNDLLRSCLALLTPPENIFVSEWAEKYRRLSSSTSAQPGKWKNSQTPHMIEVMDCFNDPDIDMVVVMSSAQIAKSECLLNIIGSIIHLSPGPILLLQPTISTAQAFSKDRVAAMFRDCPIFRGLVDASVGKRSSNTILHKEFKGGQLTIAGANSPTELASRPIKYLFIDEVDRMSITKEGDPVNIVLKRTSTFFDSKVYLVSTPTLAEFSRIDRAYKQGDQRIREIPCPKCGIFQKLLFSNIEYSTPEDAKLKCISCGYLWTDSERKKQLIKGRWRATNKKAVPGIASFHLSELYSLWRSIPDIVQAFLSCGENDSLLQVFNNTVLGEVHKSKVASVVDYRNLLENIEKYDTSYMPARATVITAGVDVHGDRIMIEVVAWGEQFESWNLDYTTIYGATDEERVWIQLTDYINRKFLLVKGGEIGIKRVAIDLGYNTLFVKRWVKKNRSKVIGVKGLPNSDVILSVPKTLDTRNRKRDQHGVLTYMVGVDRLKEELYSFLKRKRSHSGKKTYYPLGYCHFPQDRDKLYFKELVAEERVIENYKGEPRYRWVRPNGRANEALDCRVYARAALYHTGYDRKIDVINKKIRPKVKKKQGNEYIFDF